VDSACFYSLINNYRKACAYKSDKLFGDTKLLTTKKLLQGLRGVENVYTQHQSLLRALLLEMVRQRRVEDVHYPAGFSFTSRFVVHVLGGYTYEEVRDVYQINKDNGCNVTLGGCSILRSEDVINELS
jgi:vacuolar protein sorting-associated protein 45